MSSYDYTTHNTGSSGSNVSITTAANLKPNKQFRKKKPYVGFTREVLRYIDLSAEPKDVTHNIAILDDEADAYVMTATAEEVKRSVIEGKHAIYSWFRIASFPQIRTEDLEYVPGLDTYARSSAKEAIYKQEDFKLVLLLEDALKNAVEVNDQAWEDAHRLKGHYLGVRSSLSQYTYNQGVAAIRDAELKESTLLINPRSLPAVQGIELYDFTYRRESVCVPEGKAYLLAERDYLGAFVSMYGIKEKVNNQPDQFYEGTVLDEIVAMMVLNPDGIVEFSL